MKTYLTAALLLLSAARSQAQVLGSVLKEQNKDTTLYGKCIETSKEGPCSTIGLFLKSGTDQTEKMISQFSVRVAVEPGDAIYHDIKKFKFMPITSKIFKCDSGCSDFYEPVKFVEVSGALALGTAAAMSLPPLMIIGGGLILSPAIADVGMLAVRGPIRLVKNARFKKIEKQTIRALNLILGETPNEQDEVIISSKNLKKVLKGIMMIDPSSEKLKGPLHDQFSVENLTGHKSSRQVLNEMFDKARIPLESEIVNKIWAGRCFKGKNSVTNILYVFREGLRATQASYVENYGDIDSLDNIISVSQIKPMKPKFEELNNLLRSVGSPYNQFKKYGEYLIKYNNDETCYLYTKPVAE